MERTSDVPPGDAVSAALARIDSWGAAPAAAGVLCVNPGGTCVSRSVHGDGTRTFELASVTKLLTAMAVLLAVEEGTLSLDESAGPPGSTVAHLLAHASGLGPDGEGPAGGRPLAPPGVRRIYSNAGFEILATLVAQRAGMDFAGYLEEGVLTPLRMTRTHLAGSPASGATGTVDDLLLLCAELLTPRLLAAQTVARATSVAFPGLPGVLPGYGSHERNDWGLGFEIKDSKVPHWTPGSASPGTFGHFGQSGGFLWIDPHAAVALVSLSSRPFGDWAVRDWPALGEEVLRAARDAAQQ